MDRLFKGHLQITQIVGRHAHTEKDSRLQIVMEIDPEHDRQAGKHAKRPGIHYAFPRILPI